MSRDAGQALTLSPKPLILFHAPLRFKVMRCVHESEGDVVVKLFLHRSWGGVPLGVGFKLMVEGAGLRATWLELGLQYRSQPYNPMNPINPCLTPKPKP